MKVRATRLGYYNLKRRRPGMVFNLFDEKDFSEKWMEKVDGNAPEKAQKIEEEVVEADPVVEREDEDVI